MKRMIPFDLSRKNVKQDNALCVVEQISKAPSGPEMEKSEEIHGFHRLRSFIKRHPSRTAMRAY